MIHKDVSEIDEVRYQARLARKYHLKLRMEGEEGIAVKGSLVVDLVRIIKAHKFISWNNYLVSQDWEIINGNVIISDWYPIGPFRRMALAIFKELANSNLEQVREFGRANLEYFLKIYENLIVDGSPIKSLKRLINARELFVRGNLEVRIIRLGRELLQYYIVRPPEIPEREFFKALCYASEGVGEGIVLRAGGKNVISLVEEKDDGCRVTISWTVRGERD